MNSIEKANLITNILESIRRGSPDTNAFQNAAKDIGDILASMLPPDSKDKAKTINVQFIMGAKEPGFVCRTLPGIGSPCIDLDGYIHSLVADHASRAELSERWKGITTWEVEIDARLLGVCEPGYENDALYTESITAMLLADFVYTAATDYVSDLIYETFSETYIQKKAFDRECASAVEIIFEVPILYACCIKNWISLPMPYDEFDMYADAFRIGVSELLKYHSTADITKSAIEKRQMILSKMAWAQVCASDYVARKSFMRDQLMVDAMRTSSTFIRTSYMRMLDKMGVQLRERYTGFAIEGLCADHSDIYNDPNFIKEYSFETTPMKKDCFAQRIIALEANFATRLGLSKKPPMLPSERDVDMVFVDIDKVEDQFGRKAVLNDIYDISNRIDAFEEFYAEDENVMSRYKRAIEIMRNRLDQARIEILNKRSFKTNYKIFVNSPEGYEG